MVPAMGVKAPALKDTSKVYPGYPSLTVRSITASGAAEQSKSLVSTALAVKAGFIVIVSVAVQFLSSVTSIVYVPDVNPVKVFAD